MRVFALEQLAAAGESDTIGRAHAQWMATLVDHPIEVWAVERQVDREAVRREFDNWREAVNFAVSAGDPTLALRLSVHNMSASLPETGRWAESALTINGMTEQPGAYWLHYVTAVMSVGELDFDKLAHEVNAFESGCTDPRDRSWMAPFEAVRAVSEGADPALVIEDALAIPGVSRVASANLHLYRSLYRNLPPATDPDAALLAVRLLTETGSQTLPVAYAFLGVALRHTDPRAAMDALHRAEDLAEQQNDSFITASVASWGSLVVLALPSNVAAAHLERRLDKLQPHYTIAAATLLTVCLIVLRRLGDPAAARLQQYLFSTPGGAQTARTVSPELVETEWSAEPPLHFEAAVGLARRQLAGIRGAEPTEND